MAYWLNHMQIGDMNREVRLIDSDVKRLEECLICEYFDACYAMIEEPEEYPDGTCKTKSLFQTGN